MKKVIYTTLSIILFASSAFADPADLRGKKKGQDKPPIEEDIDAHPKLLRITGRFDGSGRFSFTQKSLKYTHKHWARPTEVRIDGEPWNSLGKTPGPWKDVADKIDLTGARIVKREGRDVIALEHTPDGFDLYISDSPNGGANYVVIIAIPRRR